MTRSTRPARAKSAIRGGPARARHTRLAVEVLEVRMLPSNFAVVPLWDAETVDAYGAGDNRVSNRFGGNPIAGIHATVESTSQVVHSGTGALEVKTNQPI